MHCLQSDAFLRCQRWRWYCQAKLEQVTILLFFSVCVRAGLHRGDHAQGERGSTCQFVFTATLPGIAARELIMCTTCVKRLFCRTCVVRLFCRRVHHVTEVRFCHMQCSVSSVVFASVTVSTIAHLTIERAVVAEWLRCWAAEPKDSHSIPGHNGRFSGGTEKQRRLCVEISAHV